jgi:hypothetical protein
VTIVTIQHGDNPRIANLSLQERIPQTQCDACLMNLLRKEGMNNLNFLYCTSDGRVDSLVETPDSIYLLEFKLDKTTREALDQLLSRKYYRNARERGKPVTCVGVNCTSKTKHIESWAAEP